MVEVFFNNIGIKIESFFGGGDFLLWIDLEMIVVSVFIFYLFILFV